MSNRRIPLSTTILAIAVLFFLLFSPRNSEAGMKEQVFETFLSNGMKVILLEDHSAPVISFQVWYRVGSRNEQWGKTGLTHLIEHLMFKGTEKISAGEFIRTIQESGGNYNAFTSQDFTAYFENLSSERVFVPLELESDRMKNLIFREEEFRTERMVVLEERRMRLEDNPQSLLLEQVMAAAFLTQPYHWPIIGWPEDLARIDPEDAQAYYQKYYNPTNSFLVVVGDFRRSELLPRIEDAFGSIARGVEPPKYSYDDPPQAGERRVVIHRPAQAPSVIVAYHVPTLRDPDSYVLDVIATILSGGKSSRLHERLVRKEMLALSAEAENTMVSVDPNLFHITVELLQGKDPAAVENVVDEELERLRKEPVSDYELQKAKNQLEAAFVFSQDSLFMRGMLLATYETALEWSAIDDYIPAIRSVTPEDVLRVANKYLVPLNRTVGTLLPASEEGARPAPPTNVASEENGNNP